MKNKGLLVWLLILGVLGGYTYFFEIKQKAADSARSAAEAKVVKGIELKDVTGVFLKGPPGTK